MASCKFSCKTFFMTAPPCGHKGQATFPSFGKLGTL